MQYRDWRRIAIVFSAAVLLAGCASLGEDRDSAEDRFPDWEPVTLQATGQAAPPMGATSEKEARKVARQAAALDAYRVLLGKVYAVEIAPSQRVGDAILDHDAIKARVDTYTRNAEVLDTVQLENGGAEVTLGITLEADFREIFSAN